MIKETNKECHPHQRPDAACNNILTAAYYDVSEGGVLLDGLQHIGETRSEASAAASIAGQTAVNLSGKSHYIANIWRRSARSVLA